MIRKLLIANRGEIACRITKTCREMGIATVAVYSDADDRALHVELADEAVHIGASPAAESYLNGAKIIAAAQRTGADAIHPGYGFLSENAAFAQAVIDAGLIWIGPTPAAIEAMGDKRRAKLLLKDIPLVPGYSGDDQSDEALIAAAGEIGYPLMVKAAAGGGGKGMRRVISADDLPEALASARREAQAAFGDATLILEKYIERARHIEIQIFGDTHGNIIALGERECSIQRRHQKIIEETPSTVLDDDLRQQMCDTAVSVGKQIGYVNAGTVEFILDDAKNFYFMEMNTRLQVEHPVTEEAFLRNLVYGQIEVAEGQTLFDAGLTDSKPEPEATHNAPLLSAIEVRLYAEDPYNSFLPSTGKLLKVSFPPSDEVIRIDTGIRPGDNISVFYDPMLAKIIASYGEATLAGRELTIRQLDYTLAHIQIFGIRSNISFLRRILNHPDFIAGNLSTEFVDQHPELLADEPTPIPVALIAAALAKTGDTSAYWRNNAFRPIRQTFKHNDQPITLHLAPNSGTHSCAVHIGADSYHVELWNFSDYQLDLAVDGYRQRVTVLCGDADDWWVHCSAGIFRLDWVSPLPQGRPAEESSGTLRAPMPGQVTRVHVAEGQRVGKGEVLLVMEAMKMEHRITAPHAGVVTSLYFSVGQSVQQGVKLLDVHASDVE